MKIFYLVVLLSFILSCSNESGDKKNVPVKRNAGVQITNKRTGGLGYKDSTGNNYSFRSTEVFIKNDTLVPIKIHFNIPTTWTELEPKQGQKYRCFLLPDSMTVDKQFEAHDFATGQPNTRLNNLINNKLDQLVSRTLTIQPNQTISLRLGFLITSTEGTFNASLFSQETPPRQTTENTEKTNKHDLRLILTIPPLSSEISVGRLTFLDK